MKAIADICVIPLTDAVSVRKPVARAHDVLKASGLKLHLHAYGTNVEGELGDILDAIKRVHEVLHAEGIVRISTTIKLGTRTDKDASIEAKIRAVEELLTDP